MANEVEICHPILERVAMCPIYLKVVNLVFATACNFSRAINLSELRIAKTLQKMPLFIIAFQGWILLIKRHRVKELAPDGKNEDKNRIRKTLKSATTTAQHFDDIVHPKIFASKLPKLGLIGYLHPLQLLLNFLRIIRDQFTFDP